MASRRRDDDSEEEEATAIDLRSSTAAGKVIAAVQAAGATQTAGGAKKPPANTARATPLVDDESDEDATEFLSMRPRGKSGPTSAPPTIPPRTSTSSPSGEPALRAHGRAVPLGAGPAGAPTSTPPTPPAEAARTVRDNTEPMVDIENLPRAPRPLPQRRLADESATGSHGSGSIPRITRIQVISTSSEPPAIGADDVDETTSPPDSIDAKKLVTAVKSLQKTQPLPEARIRRPTTVVQALDDATQAPDDDDVVADAGDGILVVEAPTEANVVVNGVDRGHGVVRVTGLDRSARHAVRIHCPGHLPWSGSVTLEGKPAAKIRPTLKPRLR